jgi:flagellar biosynthesis repressor protein FlbT
VHNGRVFEALKTIRAQYPREAELMPEQSVVPRAKNPDQVRETGL